MNAKLLSIQSSKTSLDLAFKEILDSRLIGYEIPKGQSLNCTWSLRLFFYSSTNVVTFSSGVANAGDDSWREYGFLKLDLEEESTLINREKFDFHEIDPLNVLSINVLINEEDSVKAECGLLLKTDRGDEILISTSPAPGAVSVRADFNEGAYDPEIRFEDVKLKNV